MRDPELVARAGYAAARLEQAWERWRALHGLGGPADPLASYVGYSLNEPMGQPRVVIGVDAAEAEFFADFLDSHDCTAAPRNAAAPGTAAAADTALATADTASAADTGPAAGAALPPAEARPVNGASRRGMNGSAHQPLGTPVHQSLGTSAHQPLGAPVRPPLSGPMYPPVSGPQRALVNGSSRPPGPGSGAVPASRGAGPGGAPPPREMPLEPVGGRARQAGRLPEPPDAIAAELAGWASGELPGQASEQLASWTAADSADARALGWPRSTR